MTTQPASGWTGLAPSLAPVLVWAVGNDQPLYVTNHCAQASVIWARQQRLTPPSSATRFSRPGLLTRCPLDPAWLEDAVAHSGLSLLRVCLPANLHSPLPATPAYSIRSLLLSFFSFTTLYSTPLCHRTYRIPRFRVLFGRHSRQATQLALLPSFSISRHRFHTFDPTFPTSTDTVAN